MLFYFAGNGFIEGSELDSFLTQLVTSINTQDTGPEVRRHLQNISTQGKGPGVRRHLQRDNR
jgi:hypothetical protein